MARIGVDLDGCLYDFTAAFKEFLTDRMEWPADLFNEQTAWHFYREWGLTDQGFVAMCNKAANSYALWNHHEADEAEVEVLHRLRSHGHTLHIITDRSFGRHPGVSQTATAQWLASNKIPYDTLTFSSDKAIVQTDFMFDDKLENFEALKAAGTKAFLFDRPWNQGVGPGHTERVSSVRDFSEHILEIPPF